MRAIEGVLRVDEHAAVRRGSGHRPRRHEGRRGAPRPVSPSRTWIPTSGRWRSRRLANWGHAGHGPAPARLSDERPEVRFQAVIAFARLRPAGRRDRGRHAGHPRRRPARLPSRCGCSRSWGSPAASCLRWAWRARALLGHASPLVRAAAVVTARFGDPVGHPVLAEIVEESSTGSITKTRPRPSSSAVSSASPLPGAPWSGARSPAQARRFVATRCAGTRAPVLARMGHERAISRSSELGAGSPPAHARPSRPPVAPAPRCSAPRSRRCGRRAEGRSGAVEEALAVLASEVDA